jgi:hypothetical protein
MKKTTALLVALLISICAYSQTFMGVPVTGTLTSFSTQLKAKGFVLSSESKPTLVIMNGKLANEEVQLLIVGTPKTFMTAKLVVYYPKQETWYSLLDDFKKVTKIITDKYGEPEKKYDFFEDPYELGDGYEMTAIRNEKCFYLQVWNATEKFPNQTLAVRINKTQSVTLIYENDKNMLLKESEQQAIDQNTY